MASGQSWQISCVPQSVLNVEIRCIISSIWDHIYFFYWKFIKTLIFFRIRHIFHQMTCNILYDWPPLLVIWISFPTISSLTSSVLLILISWLPLQQTRHPLGPRLPQLLQYIGLVFPVRLLVSTLFNIAICPHLISSMPILFTLFCLVVLSLVLTIVEEYVNYLSSVSVVDRLYLNAVFLRRIISLLCLLMGISSTERAIRTLWVLQ